MQRKTEKKGMGRKPQKQEAEVKKRQKKGKEGASEPHSTKFIPVRDAQIQKLKEAEQISKQCSLVLPGAQFREAEVEEIVEIGQAGRSAIGDTLREERLRAADAPRSLKLGFASLPKPSSDFEVVLSEDEEEVEEDERTIQLGPTVTGFASNA
ncbi:Pre-mRNA-splicing factor cef1 [Ceratobasidium sp. 392]|nr:Pre-mRNA-splicing factor cef1 [Ceratobasidium sp. 392]